MDLQPTLEGPRLLLRPLEASDLDALYAVASDPMIWAQHPCSDRHLRPVFEEFFAKGLESRGAFAIVDKGSRRLAGTSRYYDLTEGRVAIGYTFLARRYWGGDFNRELKDLMLDHAFKSVGSVIFHVGEQNARSRRAMEKIGARLVDRLERVKPDGSPDPTVVFEIRPLR